MKDLQEIKTGIEKQIESIRAFKNEKRSLMRFNEPAAALQEVEYNLITAKVKLEELINEIGAPETLTPKEAAYHYINC